MSREELKPCPLCAGSVSFHQDDLDCPDGCHHLVCSQCKSFFDLSCCADPNNETDTLDELRDRIAPIWNRCAQAEQQGDFDPELMRDAAMRTVQAMGLVYTPGADRWKPNLVAEQPSARVELSDDTLECLRDVVSHHANIVAGFAAQRLEAQNANDGDTGAYWTHEIAVAHRMKEQAERAILAASAAQGGKS